MLPSAASAQDVHSESDGSRRPLGIPTFEDKVAQRAIVMVLEAVFEQDWFDNCCSQRDWLSIHMINCHCQFIDLT